MMIDWARPGALALLLPVAVLAWWLWRVPGRAAVLPRVDPSLRAALPVRILARVPSVLRILVLLLLVLAIAGPRTEGAVVEEQTLGVPIVIALDMSSSMLARDLGAEDRLTVAKSVIREFVVERARDPVGIVAFAGESLTLVPVTLHRPILASALDQIVVGLLEDGTAIGDGLATAVARLRGVEAESRVVILMSDGESNQGVVEPMEAARAAETLGIVVHTIGVGSDRVDPAAGAAIAAEERGRLDDALLRRIADVTGGRYFRADEPGSLERIYEEIDRLVASPVETRRHVRYREWHLALLLAGAFGLLVEWGLRASRWGMLP